MSGEIIINLYGNVCLYSSRMTSKFLYCRLFKAVSGERRSCRQIFNDLQIAPDECQLFADSFAECLVPDTPLLGDGQIRFPGLLTIGALFRMCAAVWRMKRVNDRFQLLASLVEQGDVRRIGNTRRCTRGI